MTEKTGFEPTQNLPLSDKDVFVIMDSLRSSIQHLDNIIASLDVTNQVRILLMERQKVMQNIINKLNQMEIPFKLATIKKALGLKLTQQRIINYFVKKNSRVTCNNIPFFNREFF